MKKVLSIITVVMLFFSFVSSSYAASINPANHPSVFENRYERDFYLNNEQEEQAEKIIQKHCSKKYMLDLNYKEHHYEDQCRGKKIKILKNGSILLNNKGVGRWK